MRSKDCTSSLRWQKARMSLRRIRASRQVAEQLLFYDTCWNSVAYLSSDPFMQYCSSTELSGNMGMRWDKNMDW